MAGCTKLKEQTKPCVCLTAASQGSMKKLLSFLQAKVPCFPPRVPVCVRVCSCVCVCM